MFIRKIWQFNKMVTVAFLLFISLWAYIDLKRGAVATPLLQYGMFSGKYYINDTQKVIHLFINSEMVDFTKYSMSERDQLQIFLEDYLNESKNNELVFNSMHRVMDKIGIGQWMKKEYYTNTISNGDFTKWYKKMAEGITGKKIERLEAFQQKYIWRYGQLTAIGSPVKLSCIVDL